MGGKAFDNTQPIHRDNIEKALRLVRPILDRGEYRLLGSTGKKAWSGDIDIAMHGTTFGLNDLKADLVRLLGAENVSDAGLNFNQVYTRVQSFNLPPVQVDFMVGQPSLLQFTHWSPAEGESEYGGRHRTELLKAVAKAMSDTRSRDGKVVARTGFTLHHHWGLELASRWNRPRKDDPSKLVTKMTRLDSVDLKTFVAMYPDLRAVPDGTMVDEVRRIIGILFQVKLPVKIPLEELLAMVNSYEDVCSLICLSAHLDDKRDLIWQLYTERLDYIKTPHPRRMI